MTDDLYPRRAFYEDDHEAVRSSARSYAQRSLLPYLEEWEEDHLVPREPWLEAGKQGFLAPSVPEEFGGGGTKDFRFRAVVMDEFSRLGAGAATGGMGAHTDIMIPYLIDLATPEQAERWLPAACTGENILAIAMTEPGTGSDLQGIRTSARRDGDDWMLNGSKTFITNGINADSVIVVARTDPDASAGSRAFSLLVVERGMPGFERGRKLKKVGLQTQDTAELVFTDVRVPAANVLGEIGGAMRQLMSHLPLERLSIAWGAVAGARANLQWTLDYTRDRTAFGTRIADFQNTSFALAELVTELDVTQAYLDECVLKLNDDQLSAVDAAKAKWWATEFHKRLVDRCVQFFGGYGYMLEYPIAKAYADTRISTIYGGTTEIMKLIIARDLLSRRS